MKIKKTAALLFALLMFGTGALADEITVIVNGNKIESDVPAMVINDRTMLPMRAIFEELGANVTWIGEEKLIFATEGPNMVVMQIDNPIMSVQRIGEEGIEAVELDTAPFVYNDRTLVPVRAAAEALEATVQWDDETKTVTIIK